MKPCYALVFVYILFILPCVPLSAQSAIMDVESTTQGVLLPRMTETQRDGILSPAHALIIYQTDASPGFYYNEGTPAVPDWQALGGGPMLPCESRTPIDVLPYSITASGSYYVTNHLIGTSGVTGIDISVSNVTIDLNGFTLLSGGGTVGNAIEVTANIDNLNIYNGNIQGWGDEGIDASSANNSTFENLRLLSNQQDGLIVGNNNIIINCQSRSNTSDGIDAGQNCNLVNCIASSNGDDGVETDKGCTLSNCSSYQNTDDGINVGISNTLLNCTSNDNGDRGFNANLGCIITHNAAANNAGHGFEMGANCVAKNNTSRSNTGSGYSIGQESIIHENLADGNGQAGFATSSSRVRIEQNQSTTNGTYGYSVQGIADCIIIKNSATGNSISNYNIAVGHSAGPIIGPSLAGASNPFSNISL